MGLFSLFIKSPEDLEKKGDTLILSEQYGPARTEYAKALEKLEGKGDGQASIVARVEEKYAGCGEALAQAHLENAAELLASGIDAEARHLLRLAGTLAVEAETQAAIAALVGELDRAMAQEEEVVEDGEQEVVEYTEEDQAFEALCMSLPEAQGDAYLDYGDAFRDGYNALNSGSFEAAEEALGRALEENGEDSYVPMELATACHNLGKNREAEALLQTFLIHHPAHTQGLSVLCQLFLEGGEAERALSTLDGAVEALAELPVTLVVLKARILVALDRGGAAEAWLGDYLEKDWDDSVAFYLASLMEERGDTQAARVLLESSMGRCTGCGRRPPSHVQLAYSNLLKADGDTSVPLIERYLKLAMEDPATAPAVYTAVSEIYRTRGNAPEADRYAAMVAS